MTESHPSPSDVQLLNAGRAVIQAFADLCQALNCDPDLVTLAALDAHTWPDASLGIRSPDEVYGQRLTSGWIIQFRYRDASYIYHASAQGLLKRWGEPWPPSAGSAPVSRDDGESGQVAGRTDGNVPGHQPAGEEGERAALRDDASGPPPAP